MAHRVAEHLPCRVPVGWAVVCVFAVLMLLTVPLPADDGTTLDSAAPTPTDGTGGEEGVSGASPEVAAVLAVSDDLAYGEYLASECAACHDPHAPTRDMAVPHIHGIAAETIAAELLAFRAGARESDIMQSVAAALNDEEIAVLAKYLSTQSNE